MNYTKCAWKYEGDGIITAVSGKQIASVFPRDRLANAHLIAAAPDIYNALQECTEALKTLIIKYGNLLAEESPVYNKAIKALAKAEGK